MSTAEQIPTTSVYTCYSEKGEGRKERLSNMRRLFSGLRDLTSLIPVCLITPIPLLLYAIYPSCAFSPALGFALDLLCLLHFTRPRSTDICMTGSFLSFTSCLNVSLQGDPLWSPYSWASLHSVLHHPVLLPLLHSLPCEMLLLNRLFVCNVASWSSPLYPQPLAHSLAHSRCLINIFEWLNFRAPITLSG